MNPIAAELKILLDDLDAIAEDAEEIGDTDVREDIADVIFYGFLKPADVYEVPDDLGMFSDEGNGRVKAALEKFLRAVTPKIGSEGLQTPQERMDAFQDGSVESDEGMVYDDYFGYSDSI